MHFNRLVKGASVHCTLNTCKNGEAFVDVTVFLHHATTAHAYDLKIGPRHLKRCRRNYSTNTLSVNDLAMDLTIGSTIDSTTDVTMSGTQTPAPSVGSEILLDIGPRLLTVPVEVDKSEGARTSTCPVKERRNGGFGYRRPIFMMAESVNLPLLNP